MKSKQMVWMYLLVLSLGTILSLYIPKNEVVAKDSIVIPGDAIRLRILANSDKESDQALKRKVRDAVNAQITLWVKDLTSLDKAKTVIKGHLPELEQIAERVVRDAGANQSVNVEFGKVQFPTKLYGDFLYPAGDYQAVLITLGKGEGANWWCVLFPPLCFLDFSNGVAVSQGFEGEHKVEAAAVTEDKPEKAAPAKESVTYSERPAQHVEDNSVRNGTGQDNERQPVRTVQPEVKSERKADVEAPVAKEQVAQAKAPVYTEQDEEPIKVKFFVVELFEKLFN
jgi:stage II sporulation protein R